MYATELVANHFIDDFVSTHAMDEHADSKLSTQEVRVGGSEGSEPPQSHSS